MIWLIIFSCIFSKWWLFRKFGNVTIQQTFYHLQFLIEDRLIVDHFLLISFCKLIFLVFLLSIFFVFIEIKIQGIYAKLLGALRFSMLVMLPIAIIVNNISDFKFFFLKDDFFTTNYINPRVVNFNVSNPKNLLLIYVEGFDESYSNTELFGDDLLFQIKKTKGISFNSFEQINEGVGWTVAGIFSSQCGIPLGTFFLFNGNQEYLKNFAKNVNCLGNTLLSFGYKNIFMGGASLNFAGKGIFLREHGYSEVWGKEEWLSSGKYQNSDLNDWGLFDDHLFDEATQKLDQLVSSGGLFNLTLLTLDTHPPIGYPSKSCAQNNRDSFENVVMCTSDNLAKLIQHIKQKGYLSNLRVVIIGDHLAMQNPAYKKLQSLPKRTIFNYWLADDKVIKNREEIIHFDIAPSILDFIGINVIGSKYGLGYSGFSQEKIKINEYRVNEFNNRRIFYNEDYRKIILEY